MVFKVGWKIDFKSSFTHPATCPPNIYWNAVLCIGKRKFLQVEAQIKVPSSTFINYNKLGQLVNFSVLVSSSVNYDNKHDLLFPGIITCKQANILGSPFKGIQDKKLRVWIFSLLIPKYYNLKHWPLAIFSFDLCIYFYWGEIYMLYN